MAPNTAPGKGAKAQIMKLMLRTGLIGVPQKKTARVIALAQSQGRIGARFTMMMMIIIGLLDAVNQIKRRRRLVCVEVLSNQP